jgi:hypothetical protein
MKPGRYSPLAGLKAALPFVPAMERQRTVFAELPLRQDSAVGRPCRAGGVFVWADYVFVLADCRYMASNRR